MIANLILAAGASTRMGGTDKLLERVDGTSLLARQVTRALTIAPTVVTLPSAKHPRRGVLPQAAQVVVVTGVMSDSIKTGVAALPADVTGVMILPADMPDITAQDMQSIHDAARTNTAPIVRATTQDGRPGHPVYVARALFARLHDLTGDHGAGRVLSDLTDQTVFVPLDGQRARLDLDTPDDWDQYRKGLSS